MAANVGKNKEKSLHSRIGRGNFSPAPKDIPTPIRGLQLATILILILISFMPD